MQHRFLFTYTSIPLHQILLPPSLLKPTQPNTPHQTHPLYLHPYLPPSHPPLPSPSSLHNPTKSPIPFLLPFLSFKPSQTPKPLHFPPSLTPPLPPPFPSHPIRKHQNQNQPKPTRLAGLAGSATNKQYCSEMRSYHSSLFLFLQPN